MVQVSLLESLAAYGKILAAYGNITVAAYGNVLAAFGKINWLLSDGFFHKPISFREQPAIQAGMPSPNLPATALIKIDVQRKQRFHAASLTTFVEQLRPDTVVESEFFNSLDIYLSRPGRGRRECASHDCRHQP